MNIKNAIIFLLLVCTSTTQAYWNIEGMEDNDFLPSGELNWRTAHFGIKASNYIYESGISDISIFMSNNGFTKLQDIDVTKTVYDRINKEYVKIDLQAAVFGKDISINNELKRLVVFAIRGTEGVADLITDFEADWVDWPGGGKVHQGFWASVVALKQELRTNVMDLFMDSNSLIFVTGHSLGGSIATLFTADLIDNGKSPENLLVYTYGAAGLANKGFFNTYKNKFNLHRIHTKNDLIEGGTNIYYRLTNGYMFPDGGHSSSKYYIPKIATMYRRFNDAAVYSWNGNASIINDYNGGVSQDGELFGVTLDVSKNDPLTPKNSFNSFQWQVNTSNGRNLLIKSKGVINRVRVCYSPWKYGEKKFCRGVDLPFVLDPSKDGFSPTNGSWFVVGVSSINNTDMVDQFQVEPTNLDGSDSVGTLRLSTVIDGTHIWTGTASLIDKSTGNIEDFGANHDVAYMLKDPENPLGSSPISMNSVVFFQWQVEANNGKKVHIRSNCATKATVSYGNWDSRQNDFVEHRVDLPYVVNPLVTNYQVKNGSWRVIKVAVQETNGDNCDNGKAMIWARVIK